jgi:hypothetical protein
VCLIAGGLLLRSLVNLFEVDKGFAAEKVLIVNLSLPDSGIASTRTETAL